MFRAVQIRKYILETIKVPRSEEAIEVCSVYPVSRIQTLTQKKNYREDLRLKTVRFPVSGEFETSPSILIKLCLGAGQIVDKLYFVHHTYSRNIHSSDVTWAPVISKPHGSDDQSSPS